MYSVAQIVEHNAGVLHDVGLLVRNGCFMLTGTFLENHNESRPKSCWPPHLVMANQPTVKERALGIKLFGYCLCVLCFNKEAREVPNHLYFK